MIGLVAAAAAAPPPEIVYFALVDRFADGLPGGEVDREDPQAWHGGDLVGVRSRLDHLRRLGVTAVWLSPVSACQDGPIGPWGAYHGYWVESVDSVDERFGSMADLRALSDGLHARGMKLYLDVVYNHVGPEAPLLAEHPEWFHGLGDVVRWDDPVEAVTHDVHGLPDLAQEEEAVYAHLRDASLRLLDAARPDGFRVDAVRHLPEGFLARLGEELRAHQPGFVLLGEIFDGNADRVAARARSDRLDRAFDFPTYFALVDTVCAGAPAGRLAAALSADWGPVVPVTLVDNHDLPRLRSKCPADEDAATAFATLLTARGVPSITWGAEIGLAGAREPENRADMDFAVTHPDGELLRELIALRRRWGALSGPVSRVVWLGEGGAVYLRASDRESALVGIGAPARWEGLPGPPDEERSFGRVQVARYRRPPPTLASDPLVVVLADGVGPEVRAVGAGPLGEWDPSRGIPAVDGRITASVPEGSVLTWKLVTVTEAGVDWGTAPDAYGLASRGDCGPACLVTP